jgi:protein tyrosine phosphatase (PTP) superfamily phosphohydrolase (DUF442 family)
MRPRILFLLCALALPALAPGQDDPKSREVKVGTAGIYNYRRVDEQFITGGQPNEMQLKAAAQEGYRVIINLATIDPRYSLPDEAASVTSLGMKYHHIPVLWDHPTDADFAAFERVMQDVGNERTLVHCAANYRATAFYTLYAEKHLGWSKERGREFRASIWGTTNKFPEWAALIERTEAQIFE